MYREQKAPNRLLQKKWQDKEYQLHKQKIRSTKAELGSSFDGGTVNNYKKNAKALMMQEGMATFT